LVRVRRCDEPRVHGEELGEHDLVAAREGGVALLVGHEDGRGEHHSAQRLAAPALDLGVVLREIGAELKHRAHLGA